MKHCVCVHVSIGGGFAAFGQGKAAVAQFGQNMAAPGVTNNPFLVCTDVYIYLYFCLLLQMSLSNKSAELILDVMFD